MSPRRRLVYKAGMNLPAHTPARPTRPRLPLALLVTAALAGAAPASQAEMPAATTVSLVAEGHQEAANDLAVAGLFAEAADPQPGEVARRVNATVATALTQVKKYPDVKVRTGTSQTFPIYGKNNRNIESWRMRTELRLESRNLAALAELVALLQKDLALAEIHLQPAPETRKQAQDSATRSAIEAFQTRAGMIAATLGKRHRLRHLDVGTQGIYPPPRPLPRVAMAEATAPLPMEAGTSTVTTTVSGTIELID
jgi:predicted secreted protein